MAQRQVTIWNATFKQFQAIQPGDTYLLAADVDLTGNLTVTGLVDGRNIGLDGAKLDFITLTAPIDLDALQSDFTLSEAVTDLIQVTTLTDLDPIKTKVGHISVTQPVDLDALETRVEALDSSVILKGEWDASLGTFPVSIEAGESWVCTVAGSISGEDFAVNDRVIALVDGASLNVYAGQWIRQSYSGEVTSVAGKKGVVLLEEADISDLQPYLLATDLDTIGKLNALCGENLVILDQISTFAELQLTVADAVLVDEVALTAAITAQNGWRLLGGNLISEATGAGTPTLLAFGPSGGTKRRSFGIGDSVYFAFTIPHDFKAGSLVIPAVEFNTNGVDVSTVKWEFRYNITHSDGVTSSDVVISVETAAGGVAWQNVISLYLAGIAGLEVGSLVTGEVKRITNGVTDNLDTVFGLHAGLYYEADRIGTLNMTKPYYS